MSPGPQLACLSYGTETRDERHHWGRSSGPDQADQDGRGWGWQSTELPVQQETGFHARSQSQN